MPGPFEAPADPSADTLVHALERGHRAQQILSLGVADDLERRRLAIYRLAEQQLVDGVLTPDLAFTHIACANGLRRYHDELKGDISKAQRAADKLHAEPAEDQDGNV